MDKSSTDLYRLNLRQPAALVFGNEHRGVSDRARQLADKAFHIPMAGFAQSLNVSVAAAVSLYEALRQRRGRLQRQSRSQPARLLAQWARRA